MRRRTGIKGVKNMKKLFVSIPMKGRTEEEIKASIQKMKKIAEIYEGEELELIDSYIDEEPTENCNRGVWFLAKSIDMLSEADVFIGIQECYDWKGCWIENGVAEKYDIKRYSVRADYVIDDYSSVYRKAHTECVNACFPG
jgi:hypothetical protein